jgi:hypothetical protein
VLHRWTDRVYTVAEQDQACFRILFSILNSYFRLLVSGFWFPSLGFKGFWHWSTGAYHVPPSVPPSCPSSPTPTPLLVVGQWWARLFCQISIFLLNSFDGPPHGCLSYNYNLCVVMYVCWMTWRHDARHWPPTAVHRLGILMCTYPLVAVLY